MFLRKDHDILSVSLFIHEVRVTWFCTRYFSYLPDHDVISTLLQENTVGYYIIYIRTLKSLHIY